MQGHLSGSVDEVSDSCSQLTSGSEFKPYIGLLAGSETYPHPHPPKKRSEYVCSPYRVSDQSS